MVTGPRTKGEGREFSKTAPGTILHKAKTLRLLESFASSDPQPRNFGAD